MFHKCEDCHKVLASKFSLQRHKSKYHPTANGDYEDDDHEHDVSSENDEKSEKHIQIEEAAEETKNHEQESVWTHYANEAWNEMEEICSQDDVDEANWKSVEKKLNKQFVESYKNDLLHYEALENDETHEAVMKTKRKFMEDDDMDEDEATSAAVKHRKHLIIGQAPDWLEKYNDECRKNDKTQ